MKMITEMTYTKEKMSTKEKRQWGATFVRGMSALQLFLGFCCVVIGLVGLAAGFHGKLIQTELASSESRFYMRRFYRELYDNMTRIVRNMTIMADRDRNNMLLYYEGLFKNMTIIDKKERKALIEHCQNQTNKPGVSDNPDQPYENQYRTRQYDDTSSAYLLFKYEDPPASNLPHVFYQDFPDPCERQEYSCYSYWFDRRMREAHLIVNYLCVPAWTGIMLMITGLVGLRMMASKESMEYLQVSHSFTVLNVLNALLFAPGMMAVGILEWLWGANNYHGFRKVVGQITIGFAGPCLLVALVLCIVGCCCPVSSLPQDNKYKGLVEEKPHDEDKKKIITA